MNRKTTNDTIRTNSQRRARRDNPTIEPYDCICVIENALRYALFGSSTSSPQGGSTVSLSSARQRGQARCRIVYLKFASS
jgi:hypothetical protein